MKYIKHSDFSAMCDKIRKMEAEELVLALQAHGGKFVWVDDDNNEELLYEPPTIMVNTDEGPMDVVVYEARLNNGHINLLAYDKEWGNKQHIELEYIATGHLAYLIEYMPVTDKVKSVAINDD